mgnify:CR=1 FL=1
MAKKLTPTLARILAENVRAKLTENAKDISLKHQAMIKDSKEYKEYEKLRRQNIQIEDRMKDLKKETEEKYSTTMMHVQLGWSSNDAIDASVIIRETKAVSADAIRDAILLEDYFADSSISHDELVDKIVKKFL